MSSLTGYFKEAHKLDRKAYISRAKVGLALEGLEYYFSEYGEGIRRPETLQQIEGRKLHAMTLEPEEFRKNRMIHRFQNLKSPEAQTWIKRVNLEYPQATIMSLEESLRYDRIVDRVMSHKLAGPLISQAVKERHGYATCERTGALLYSRPDILTAFGEIAELKFVRSVDEFDFNREQYSYKWFMQLAFYNAVEGLIKKKRLVDNCFYIAVEHYYPHRVAVLTLDPTYEQMGEILWNEGLDKIQACMALDPQMKNFEVWRSESFKARKITPEYFMLNNDQRFRGLIGIGA